MGRKNVFGLRGTMAERTHWHAVFLVKEISELVQQYLPGASHHVLSNVVSGSGKDVFRKGGQEVEVDYASGNERQAPTPSIKVLLKGIGEGHALAESLKQHHVELHERLARL